MPIPLRRATVGALIGAVATTLLVACDPADPYPPPTPPTTSTAAPASSASPTPSMSVRERDYAAAAEAFKNANRVVDEALGVGDGKIPKQELSKYAVPDDPYWLTETQAIERAGSDGLRAEGLSKVVSMIPIGDYTPNQISMYSCVDGRKVSVLKNGKFAHYGILGAARLTFRKSDGRWRVVGYLTAKDGTLLNFQPVEECVANPK